MKKTRTTTNKVKFSTRDFRTSTPRFCANCNKITSFNHNKTLRHSRCSECNCFTPNDYNKEYYNQEPKLTQ